MNDRRKLLTLCVAVMAAVSLIGVSVALVHCAAWARPGDLSASAIWLSFGSSVIVIFAGATILLRVITPWIGRLEESEAGLRRHVAELEAAGEALARKADELAAANQELDDFGYIVSHDLKEPLRGIAGYCQLLREDYGPQLDAEAQRRLQRVVDLCQRLACLVDDLLNYSKLGRERREPADIDLQQVFDNVLTTLGPAIDQRHGQVKLQSRLPIVRADATMAGEVLANLINNGLKYNSSPCPTVEVGCLPGDVPTLFVHDNGIGIDRTHHEAIFTMFRRLHGPHQFGGTGAGLTITKKIVETHGGRIWVESEPGRGSTFYFTLGSGRPAAPHIARLHAESAAT